MTPANIVNPATDACVADETYDCIGAFVAGLVLFVADTVPLTGPALTPPGPAGAPAALAGETVPAFAFAPAPAPAEAPFGPV